MLVRTQGDYQVFWSKEHNREYYFHPPTSTTTWSLPPALASPTPATPTPAATPAVATPAATPTPTAAPARKYSDAELTKLFDELSKEGQAWAKLEQKEFEALVETKKARFQAEQKSYEDVIANTNAKIANTPKKDKNYHLVQQSAKAAKEGAIEAMSNSRINRKEEELELQKVMKYREAEGSGKTASTPPASTASTATPVKGRSLTVVTTPHHSPTNSIDAMSPPDYSTPRLSIGSAAALANPEMLKFLKDRGGAGILTSMTSPTLTRPASLSVATPPSTPATPQAPPGALRSQGDYYVYYSHEHKREYYFHLPTQQTLWSLPPTASPAPQPAASPAPQPATPAKSPAPLTIPSTPVASTLSATPSTPAPSPSLSPLAIQIPLSPTIPANPFQPPSASFPPSNPSSQPTSSEATPRCSKPNCAKWAYRDGLCKVHSEEDAPKASPSASMGNLADQLKAAQAAKAARQEAMKLQGDKPSAPAASFPPSPQPRPVADSFAPNHSSKAKDVEQKTQGEEPGPRSSPPPENSAAVIQSVAANIALAKKRREEKEAAEKAERERIAAEKEATMKADRERKAAAAKALEEKRAAEKALADKADEERRAALAAQRALEEQRAAEKAAEKAAKAARKEAEKKAAEERAAAEKEKMYREATERLMAERAKQALAEQDEAADNEILSKLTAETQKNIGLDFVEKLHLLKRAVGSPEAVAHLVRVMLQRSMPYRPGDKPAFWVAPSEKGAMPIRSSGFSKPVERNPATERAAHARTDSARGPHTGPVTQHTRVDSVKVAPPPPKAVAAVVPPGPPKGDCIDPACDCVNFQPDAFRKDKCRNCFHNHSPAIMKAKAEQDLARREAEAVLSEASNEKKEPGEAKAEEEVKKEAAKQAEEEEVAKKAAEEEAKKAAEEEAKRAAEEAAKRAAEEEEKRKAEEEAKRRAEEEEAKRKAEEEEAKRKAEEEEAKRKAEEEEVKRKAEEEEAKRKAEEEEAKRKAEEEEVKRKAEEEEVKRKAEEEEVKRKAEEEEVKRKAEEEEVKRKAEEEAAKRKAEEEAKRKAEEEEAKRKAEEEEVRKAEEEEAKKEEAKRLTEEEAAKAGQAKATEESNGMVDEAKRFVDEEATKGTEAKQAEAIPEIIQVAEARPERQPPPPPPPRTEETTPIEPEDPLEKLSEEERRLEEQMREVERKLALWEEQSKALDSAVAQSSERVEGTEETSNVASATGDPITPSQESANHENGDSAAKTEVQAELITDLANKEKEKEPAAPIRIDLPVNEIVDPKDQQNGSSVGPEEDSDGLLLTPSTQLSHARRKSPTARKSGTAKKPFSFNTAVVEARAVEGYGEAVTPTNASVSEAEPKPRHSMGVPLVSGDMMAEMMRRRKTRESDSSDNGGDSVATEEPRVRKPSVGMPPMIGGAAMMEEMRRKREEASQRPRGDSSQTEGSQRPRGSSQTPEPNQRPRGSSQTPQPAPPPPNFLEDMRKRKEAKAEKAAA